jgi:heme A synthase
VQSENHSWLHVTAILLAVCTLFDLATGTAVTTNEARPLYSFGQWHAVVGGLIGILALGLVIPLSQRASKGVRPLVWAALAVLVVEALLGLVAAPQPVALRVIHTLLGQVFCVASVATAVFTSPAWKRRLPVVEQSAIRTLVQCAPAVMLVQTTLGVLFRQGVIEMMPHILGALVVGIFVAVLCAFLIYRPEYEPLRPAAVAALIITGVQILLGFVLYTMTVSNLPIDPAVVVIITMIHGATAALTFAATVVLAALAWHAAPSPVRGKARAV